MKLLRYLRELLLLGICLSLPQPAVAGEVVLHASRDNTLYSDDVLSNGSGEWLFAGRTADGRIRRGLIHFDVADAIPAGSRITGVALELYMSRTNTDSPVRSKPIAAHRVTRDWGEGASDALVQEGDGIAAEAGDATWEYATYDTVPWETPGGDYVADYSAKTAIGDVGWYTWEAEAMAADVQGWVDDPTTCFGWILIGVETVDTTARRFNARENSSEDARPILRVTYEAGTTTEPTGVRLSSWGTVKDDSE